MEWISYLRKMRSYEDSQVQYLLKTENDFIHLNKLIHKTLKINYLGEKKCSSCQNIFPDLFRMGFCKNCFFTAPEAAESIIRPELSRAHLDKEDRDLDFEKSFQLQEHVVYIAQSGGVKVGVTRAVQMRTRWIDQGASSAIVLARTENRFLAGQIEVVLKNYLNDKTNYRKMLSNDEEEVDLLAKKHELSVHLEGDLKTYVSQDNEINKFEYPVDHYPLKVNSLNLDKVQEIEKELIGIRGQYLIFSDNSVLNIRASTGAKVRVSI